MPRIFGHSEETARKLTELVSRPANVGPANTTPRKRPQFIGGGGGLAKTPGGGIPAMTGSGSGGSPWDFGSASCTRVDVDTTAGTGTTSASSITLYNMVATSVAGNKLVQYKWIDGLPFVDVEPCS